ncbi:MULTISPECIES: NIPSNAP family protein [unclassified Undibacterium]|uniref:NIPSNAP family protein n=1 Tax=unclassified Undibacterium TaxID=2630295 RepID=UPI002AC8C002|nr:MULTISPECIES: NIPSNAP family protein [unclassified Undibacterium]MEB0140134.1 NIPSNAP family protein [Undibacterium sp. CCC2.1]MEB0173598.1 NIPSNAP family protein [Undibacterium sp. CCC1.1]MEB0177545.1 NIPSNAP family protein [Undibacterium sp. CCC3.4]MEB0214451.1 NIPSNAP family protein [Undibacterium sp. 5I2]WPX42848.1 NIPSNAP family protein [Undibacterium sp. CCC3.4]
MKKLVEFRSYILKPECRDAFHRLVQEASYPLLRNWGVDVVDYGPSAHDINAYYLIRAYCDLPDRAVSQDAFYGSSDWRDGPRESIVALIECYTSFTLELDEAVVKALRTQ